MLCECNCPIHSKGDSIKEGKQCVYNATWTDNIEYNPKHW